MITLASTNKDGPIVRVFATKCTCIKHISQATIARKKPDITEEEKVLHPKGEQGGERGKCEVFITWQKVAEKMKITASGSD